MNYLSKRQKQFSFRNGWLFVSMMIVLMCVGIVHVNAGNTETITIQPTITVTGTVADNEGTPMPGVNVMIKGTVRGVVTDYEGRYSIQVPDKDAVLIYSFIGFITQEFPVGEQVVINITLNENTQEIEEVVVVGYGVQKKVNLTGAVQNVTGAELTKRSTPNASVALQGLIPGVSVVQSSGQPGADGATITIRGTGSLNSSTTPLILIDGVEGDINNVDINAIESISVLKDAASASIYGSRASNGVILVTTKRSKEEQIKVSYNGYVGFNTPTELPDPVSAVGYMEAVNTARANGGLDPQYSQALIDQYLSEGADNYNRYDTNWRDEVIKKTAWVQNHSVSLSGGSRQISYFANAGYYSQEGQIPNNSYSRMTLRVNTDARITDWLKIGLDLNLRQSEAKRPSQQEARSIINSAITFTPVFSGINNDGTWGYGQNGDNPIAVSKVGGVHTGITPELGIRGFIQLNPFAGFDVLASYSSRKQEYKVKSFIKQYDTYETGAFRTSWPATGQQSSEEWSQDIRNQFNLQITYEKNMGKHYLKAFAGMQTEELIKHSFSASRKGYDFPGFEDLKHGDIATASNNSGHNEWAMLSYLWRLNYSFSDRYLFEVNGRWDASSRFMSDERWGFFPSASVGWRISEETFFDSIRKTINNLKIRGSYGTLGNQDISFSNTPHYYPYAVTLSPGNGYWFNKTLSTGVIQKETANQKISWEKSTQLNIGLDAGLFNSRLNLTFDYYVRNIDDLLQKLPIPAYVGLEAPWENAGSMRNKGWDLSISWRDKVGDFSYSIAGNLSDVKNKVINLYGKEYLEATYTIQEGYPFRSWFGYVSDGYFQSQTEIDEVKAVYGGNKGNVKPGYVRYKDISGPDGKTDDVIDGEDRRVIGDPFPRYQFGLSLGAEWKGFDLSVFFQGVGKKDILLTGAGARPFYVGRTIFKHQLDTWTPENPNAEYPLLLIEGQAGTNPNNIVSDFWIKSGAYMRLKNLMIGYTLPASVLSKIKLEYLRFYISGQNLFTICNAYKGYDPENDVQGGSYYPLMQTFTFGIDLRF